MTHELLLAVQHANRVLDWHENLVSEEIPPPWMWHLDHEIEAWFEQVEYDRKVRFQSGGDSDDFELSTSTKNELARDRR